MRRVSILAAIAVLCLAGSASWAADKTAVEAATDPSAIHVLLAADLETTLSSQMSGTLGALHAELGQQVAKDTLLAQFDCNEAQARANVANAEAAMARQSLEAKRSLRKLNAVGDIEVAMANTELEKAQGAQSLAKTQSAYCEVRAPFNARVAKVYAKPYQTISAGTPLFDLVSDGALKIRLNAPSSLLRDLKAGMPFQVRISETGKTYPVHLTAINARVDAVAQTVELEARFDKENPELIDGMSGIALLPAGND
ncbi:MAG TPA: efflux RND transporter periplasmic adaptor subunit [Alphaproteobacteria bacterium]|jgi:RND family efflux transporter MFP subunit|nr:efflux RND transporter periplasmic adaptor subunit [Alphaproteobacteria bacterium]